MNTSSVSGQRLIPPMNGVTVRMYRTGHGDCFLLAFASESAEKPVYVLIDCGYKPGSPKYVNTTAKAITRNILEATGGHLDVAVITHEHQDHVNGITDANFKGITIGETWLAWTESPNDRLAKRLRNIFEYKLVGLIRARNRLAAIGENDQVNRIDAFLEFELGESSKRIATLVNNDLGAAVKDANKSSNKRSIKLLKERASNGVKFIKPHEVIFGIPRAKDVRVFALGPPRNVILLEDLDPREDEAYDRITLASSGNYFAAAAIGRPDGHYGSPFDEQFCLPLETTPADMSQHQNDSYASFFKAHYRKDDVQMPLGVNNTKYNDEVPDNPAWRRIDNDWLYSAEQLALDMNNYTNNASLVLAFELGKGGKVLLFAADAQRGNWHSWAKKDWVDGDKKVTAKDLLARTVLYKVGHHGSHNATLKGRAEDDYANLEWMGQGEYGREFVAMITAVRKWAEKQNGWDHPLPSIKAALMLKADGRVFQTDTAFANMSPPDGILTVDWKRFQSRVVSDNPLYFDYTITSN